MITRIYCIKCRKLFPKHVTHRCVTSSIAEQQAEKEWNKQQDEEILQRIKNGSTKCMTGDVS